MSDFMVNLVQELALKRQILEKTAKSYVRILFRLNGDKPYSNLSFLRHRDVVKQRIETYAQSSQKQALTAIVAVLSLVKDKPAYKKLHQAYYDELMGSPPRPEGRSAKQEKVWKSWDWVLSHQKRLAEEVGKMSGVVAPRDAGKLSVRDWSKALEYLVLSLYTLIPPRRNEYQIMKIAMQDKHATDTNFNYCVLGSKRLIFHKYKTASKYGVQKQDIPPELWAVIETYLSHYPVPYKKKSVFLLVHADGTPFTAVNSITRILHHVFGEDIGSSMLRHIYLTDKYGDEKGEMSEDAEKMGHSVAVQQGVYVLPDDKHECKS